MRGWIRFSRAIDRFNRRVAFLAAWLTLLMVLIGAYNAVARYVERGLGVELSSNAFLELQWYLFSLVFLLGAPYALRKGAHVRVDVLYGGLSERGKLWVDLFGTVLFLVPFCAAAIYLSHRFVWDSFVHREMSNDPGGLPRWPLKPFIPLSLLLLALQGVSEAVKRIAILSGRSPEEVGLVEPPGEDSLSGGTEAGPADEGI